MEIKRVGEDYRLTVSAEELEHLSATVEMGRHFLDKKVELVSSRGWTEIARRAVEDKNFADKLGRAITLVDC